MPSKREPVSKRTRFEVFKRDHFTCQYCGGQPPDVVLVVDHISPVASGGSRDLTNLVTACEPCNQGKADKPLTTRVARPDADLLYLETQQEIAELRRYQEAKAERDRELAAVVELMQGTWTAYAGTTWAPADRVVLQLLATYDPETVEEAIANVAGKVGGRYLKEDSRVWLPYLWSVARNIAKERDR